MLPPLYSPTLKGSKMTVKLKITRVGEQGLKHGWFYVDGFGWLDPGKYMEQVRKGNINPKEYDFDDSEWRQWEIKFQFKKDYEQAKIDIAMKRNMEKKWLG